MRAKRKYWTLGMKLAPRHMERQGPARSILLPGFLGLGRVLQELSPAIAIPWALCRRKRLVVKGVDASVLTDSPTFYTGIRVLHTARLRLQVLQGRRYLDDVREPWLSLLPAARWAAFTHPAWCSAVWESYAPSGRVVFVIAWMDDRPVGIIPLCSRRMNRFGLFLPVAEAFGGARGDYCIPFVGTTEEPGVLDTLLEAAIAISEKAGVFVLPNVPAEAGIHHHVERFLRDRGHLFTRRESTCPLILLKSTVEETQRAFSRNLRVNLRKQFRRIQELHGPLSIQIVDSKQDALKLLPSFFEMHDRRWLEAGKPGTFNDPAARSFYHSVISGMWDSGVHFSTLSCGDQVVAFHFGLVSNGFLLCYKWAYDLEFHSYSPGKLMLESLVRHGVEKGWRGIDLLQGSEAYKDQWSSEMAQTFTYTVPTSSWSPSYWWLIRGRPWTERQFGAIYHRYASRIGSWRGTRRSPLAHPEE